MATVYTKTGDKGQTSLYTGQRVDKDSLRVETYGIIDELDSALGVARVHVEHEDVAAAIKEVQTQLWMLMADIASLGKEPTITDDHVQGLENVIDTFDARLEPLTVFLVPGENKSSAFLDVARTIARRAERSLWRLSRTEEVHDVDMRYLNRLSDLCFILGRVEIEVEK